MSSAQLKRKTVQQAALENAINDMLDQLREHLISILDKVLESIKQSERQKWNEYFKSDDIDSQNPTSHFFKLLADVLNSYPTERDGFFDVLEEICQEIHAFENGAVVALLENYTADGLRLSEAKQLMKSDDPEAGYTLAARLCLKSDDPETGYTLAARLCLNGVSVQEQRLAASDTQERSSMLSSSAACGVIRVAPNRLIAFWRALVEACKEILFGCNQTVNMQPSSVGGTTSRPRGRSFSQLFREMTAPNNLRAAAQAVGQQEQRVSSSIVEHQSSLGLM